MSAFVDITGFKNHNIEVISRVPKPNDSIRGDTWWKCICACGNEFVAPKGDIIGHDKKTCGCINKRIRWGSNNPRWNGCGEISATSWSSIISGAKTRNFSFNVTIEYAWDLFIKQDKKCRLSGVDLYFRSHTKASDGNASLDRIDSKIGYEPGNIQWIEKRINKMKMDLPEDVFIFLCGKIFQHRGDQRTLV